MLTRFRNAISSPKGLTLVNAILLVLATFSNIIFQAFCRPTEWATALLVLCFLNSIFYPLLKPGSLYFYFSNFISGMSLGVFVYCIIFLEQFNVLGLFAILACGLGLITYIPHFFVIQLLYKHLVSFNRRLTPAIFCFGLAAFLSVAFVFGKQYKDALMSIEAFKNSDYNVLEKSFMTEKILGMYFKYHTEICLYDGWRPPLHEPALVVGQWFHGRHDPLSPDGHTRLDLDHRIRLYKMFFSEKEVKMACSCASEYARNYHQDSLFVTP